VCGAILLASAVHPADAFAQRTAAARVPHSGGAVSHSSAAVVGQAAPRTSGAVVAAPPHGTAVVATPRGTVAVNGGHYYYGDSHYHYAYPVYPVYPYGSFYAGYPYYGGGFAFSVGVGFGYPAYPYYAYPYAYPAYPYGPYPPYGAAYPPAPVYYDNSAAMHLQVTPRNTEVYVDGYYAGIVDQFDGTFQRLNIQPGQHDIELYLPGHRVLERQVYLQPGKTTDIKYAMQPLAPGEPEPLKPTPRPEAAPPPQDQQQQQPPQTSQQRPYSGSARRPVPPPAPARDTSSDGGLTVYTGDPNRGLETSGNVSLHLQPGPATILIDGEKFEGSQEGGQLTVQLSAGTHVLDIQKDGYHRYTTEVTVRAGQTSSLNVELSKN
jgi:hypothetical protein